MLAGLRHCAGHGITSMVNMDGNLYTQRLLDGLRRAGSLPARVKVPFRFKPHMELAELERAGAMRAEFADGWLSSGMVRMFMDGVVDSRTADMLDDDPGHPGHRSEPLFPPARVAALGGTASLQPSHPPGAMDFPPFLTLGAIGRDRWPDACLHRTPAEAGARVAHASDWPVSDVPVLRSAQAAVTRAAHDGASDERLALPETLAAYTAGGAWAAHCDRVTGCLQRGLAADLALLGDDIEAAAPESPGSR